MPQLFSKKTSYFTKVNSSINAFDKSKITSGGFYHATALTWSNFAGVSQSEFIPVQVGDIIRINPSRSQNYHIVYKNSSDEIFAGVSQGAVAGTVYEFTVPENATKASTAFYDSEIESFMFTINNQMPSQYVGHNVLQETVEPSLKKAIVDVQLSEGNYKGKKLSILGDSISTFPGWNPAGNATFYDGTNLGVTDVSQTWWKRLIDQTGMELCVNNAWSGSRVTTTGGDASAGCMTRATSLHKSSVNPDVIIVYLGINDFNNEVALGSYDGKTTFPTVTTTFKEAYAIMLSKILTQYKSAEIYVSTLPDCERNGTTNFPESNDNGVLLSEWNKAIRELADLFSVQILEFSKSGLTFYNKSNFLADDLHPNPSGHKLLANKAIKTIDPSSKFSNL